MNEVEGKLWSASELYRLRGELLQMGDGSDAEIEADFQKAISIARDQETKMLELRATVRLARLWQSQGRGEQAREMLGEIYGWFTEGFESADLQEARSLLDALS